MVDGGGGGEKRWKSNYVGVKLNKTVDSLQKQATLEKRKCKQGPVLCTPFRFFDDKIFERALDINGWMMLLF